MVGMAFCVGLAFGPAIGGLLGSVTPRLACWVSAGLSLTNWLYSYLFVPESLPTERRKKFSLSRANPVGSLVLLRSHPELWRLAVIQFLAYTAHNVFSVWVLYAIYRYAWDEVTTGLSLMVVGISTGAISALLTGRMVNRFGENTTLYIGHFFGAAVV